MTLRLSFVVATDAWETVAEVAETLREQTIAPELELVVVGPQSLRQVAVDGLGAVTVVEGPEDDVPGAHAAGIRVASAPIVFLGETHAFPLPDALERLALAFDDASVGVAVPRLANANPETARSWALLLVAYGPWVTSVPRDLQTAAGFNSAWRRDILAEFGDRLRGLLGAGGGADTEARRAGWRIVAEPRAVVAHRNVTAGRAWLRSRTLSARVYAAARSSAWSLPRRLLYAAGTPVLVPMIVYRVRRSTAWREHRPLFPAGMTMALVSVSAASAVGEAVGYVVGEGDARRSVAELEIRRASYV